MARKSIGNRQKKIVAPKRPIPRNPTPKRKGSLGPVRG
jgi:hypothetical protein